MKTKEIIKNINFVKSFNFSSWFRRAQVKRNIYTPPLIDGEFKVSEARFVPSDIIRPNYACKNF
jgi:hypothetical protein